ncbi:LysR substrate-binding domain-containing protein [Hymenobacter sp.]|uniref:LysR family transcriptional regulator n=1 Tax=Hymenobacter sp. TaxID=1898978 RepID=UPI00286B6269|nr:LysR substrate-binding domain-containing protein [Hymenobacter sp.]
MFTLHHFRILQLIATHGSITRAAAEMSLTQSALSHQLRDLEAALGVTLLHRVGKALVFTEAGNRVLQTAQLVLPEVAALRGDLRRLQADAAARIRLSTECYTCYQWLSPALAAFQLQHPGVELALVPEAAADPLTQLAKGRLDIAIVSEAAAPDPWVKLPLFDDQLLLVVPAAHRLLAHPQPLAPPDFAAETLLVYSLKRPVGLLRHPFFEALRPKAVLEVHSTEAIIELVNAGLGVAIMPHWAVQPFLNVRQLAMLPLPADVPPRTWSAYVAPTAAPVVHRFVEAIRATAPQAHAPLTAFLPLR